MRRLTVVLLFASCVQSVEVLTSLATSDGGVASGAFSLTAGDRHACTVRGGPLWCWGANDDGQVGVTDAGLVLSPVQVGSERNWLTVSGGEVHTCGLRQGGSVWCWGGNGAGQLGQGDTSSRHSPSPVSLPAAAVQVQSKSSFSCALLDDASLWCWGTNYEGQLGLADRFPGVDQLSPVRVSSDAGWKTFSTGQGHACGIRLDGSMWCWGRNTEAMSGQKVDGGIQFRAPRRVGPESDWTQVDANQEYTCGLRADGTAWCWGLLPERSSLSEAPELMLSGSWAMVRTNVFHACALSMSGSGVCWGRNIEGQLGLGDLNARASPTTLAEGPLSEISTGRFASCQRRGNGSIWCTGENSGGQLGLGDTTRRRVWTQLSFP